MSFRARVAMSRAVETCRRLGKPEAFLKRVLRIPRERALRVIILAKLISVFPSDSATTTATSFADLVMSARIASFTVIDWPRFKPSLDGAIPCARRETLNR